MFPEIYKESIGFQSWTGYRGNVPACNNKKLLPYQAAVNAFQLEARQLF